MTTQFGACFVFSPHRALAARRAEAFRCAGVRLAFSEAAPFAEAKTVAIANRKASMAHGNPTSVVAL